MMSERRWIVRHAKKHCRYYLDRNTPKSIDHLESGIDRLEATGANLSSTLEQSDFTLFKLLI